LKIVSDVVKAVDGLSLGDDGHASGGGKIETGVRKRLDMRRFSGSGFSHPLGDGD